MELLKRLKDRAPEYDNRYFEMILNFTIEQGSGMGRSSEEERWKQGKYFSTRYEMYMYATLLGLKKDYRLPIPKGNDTKKFIEIKSWQPIDVADYVIMGVLSKCDLNFNELENLEEEAVEKKLTEIKSVMEEYANGGLDIIDSKMKEEPSFFTENDNCFLDLIDE